MLEKFNEIIEYLPMCMCYLSNYNPFKMEEEDNANLMKSIGSVGVIVPVLVRPVGEKYEILVGRRRYDVLRESGIGIIPAIVRRLTDAEAKTVILETNINQRGPDSLKHSELASVIYEYHSTIKSQGRRTDILKEVNCIISEMGNDRLTFSPVGEKLNSEEKSGKKFRLSARTVSRYLRLYQLQNGLKQLVDERIISIRTGVELSFLTAENQELLLCIIDDYKCNVSWEQAITLRNYQVNNIFSLKLVRMLLTQKKDRFKPSIGFRPMKRLFKKYTLQRYTVNEIESVLDNALCLYFSILEEKKSGKMNQDMQK